MNQPRHITFAGSFTVGEKKIDVHQQTIDNALQQGGHLGIVVNDINFARRLFYYNHFGFDAVLRSYELRRGILCGRTQEKCEIPPREILETMVDEDLYERAKAMCERNEITIHLNSPDFKQFLAKRVVPALVEQRLREYGLALLDYDIEIYSEREMRNIVSLRIQSKGRWSTQFKHDGMATINGTELIFDVIRTRLGGTPTCGGIMLAIYEQVAKQGNSIISELYPATDRAAIENAHLIYERLQELYPLLWPLKFKRREFYG